MAEGMARIGMPKFDGTTQSVAVAQTFLDAFEIFADTANLTEANKCRTLKFALTNEALIWYDNFRHVHYDQRDTWAATRTAFLAEYAQDLSRIQQIKVRDNIHHRAGQSTSAFMNSCVYAARHTTRRLTDWPPLRALPGTQAEWNTWYASVQRFAESEAQKENAISLFVSRCLLYTSPSPRDS